MKGIKINKKALILLFLCFVVWIIDIKSVVKFTKVKINNVFVTRILDNTENIYDMEKVYVKKVIDGDTFVLKDGRKVRIIGINTPEDTTEKELYGNIATQFAKELIENKYVYLEKDVSETDKYDRLLRTVWVLLPKDKSLEEIKTKNLSSLILSEGLAQPMTINPDITYSETYRTLAENARLERKGMWIVSEHGTTKGDF